ncbi:MAG: beta-ribofuranosylaminobenzene 5'-phosphate synthase family protein [Asgard group archaeon]|nr:beta-ribofuranosylaminobenzene 5'-phosphate synthase family protein [Asgard group archaeon]
MEILVKTPSRLHFGLIDLNGSLGRINGSLGVALNNPGWMMEILSNTNREQKKNALELYENTKQAIREFGNFYQKDIQIPPLRIKKSIPAHIGLGSHTQFLLALGKILAKFNKISTDSREIAQAMNRGGTSGIGVASFENGGIILDGGHSFGKGKDKETFAPSSISTAPPPPVIFRHLPPKNWHFVLITPTDEKGASGKKEQALFQECCPVPEDDVEKICRLILMKILPAIVEDNIKTFGEGLTEMQNEINRFGMEKYESGLHKEIMTFLFRLKTVYGSGISSFGPTIYALTNSEKHAKKILTEIKNNFSVKKFQLLDYSNINRTGAEITIKKEK